MWFGKRRVIATVDLSRDDEQRQQTTSNLLFSAIASATDGLSLSPLQLHQSTCDVDALDGSRYMARDKIHSSSGSRCYGTSVLRSCLHRAPQCSTLRFLGLNSACKTFQLSLRLNGTKTTHRVRLEEVRHLLTPRPEDRLERGITDVRRLPLAHERVVL